MQETSNRRFSKLFWPGLAALLVIIFLVVYWVNVLRTPTGSGLPNILDAKHPFSGAIAVTATAITTAATTTAAEAEAVMPSDVTDPAKDKYPGGVPSKFDPDGNVQPFPGNTIVSHLPATSEMYASLLSLHAKLREGPLAHLYAMLPPSSWHMTVFEGVCDQVRKPGYWPDDLPLDAPLVACTALFADKLQQPDYDPLLGNGDGDGDARPPYRLRAVGFSPLRTGIGLALELRTPAEDRAFRAMRDRLAERLHIRHTDHDTYGLHLSLAYLLRHLTAEQEAELQALLMEHFETMPREFELGAPEFCTFEDMFAFHRLFYLGEGKGST